MMVPLEGSAWAALGTVEVVEAPDIDPFTQNTAWSSLQWVKAPWARIVLDPQSGRVTGALQRAVATQQAQPVAFRMRIACGEDARGGAPCSRVKLRVFCLDDMGTTLILSMDGLPAATTDIMTEYFIPSNSGGALLQIVTQLADNAVGGASVVNGGRSLLAYAASGTTSTVNVPSRTTSAPNAVPLTTPRAFAPDLLTSSFSNMIDSSNYPEARFTPVYRTTKDTQTNTGANPPPSQLVWAQDFPTDQVIASASAPNNCTAWLTYVSTVSAGGRWIFSNMDFIGLLPPPKFDFTLPYGPAPPFYERAVDPSTVTPVRISGGGSHWIQSSITGVLYGSDLVYWSFFWARKPVLNVYFDEDASTGSTQSSLFAAPDVVLKFWTSSNADTDSPIQTVEFTLSAITSDWKRYAVALPRGQSPRLFRISCMVSDGPVDIALPHVTVQSASIACLPCEAGFWCDVQHIFACPPNTRSHPGANDYSQCVCVAGYYIVDPSMTQASCVMCPQNHLCEGNQSVPQACPSGMRSSAGSSSCDIVGPSAVSAAGVVTPCPPNSQAPPGSSRLSDCVCDDGFESVSGPDDIVLNGPTCSQCPVGFFCTDGTRQPCVTLSISLPGALSASECFCGPGYYGINNLPCTSCPANSWCWGGLKNRCPFNSRSPPMSSDLSSCTCVSGYVGLPGGPCSPCAPGFFKPLHSQPNDYFNATCTPCPPGTYGLATGATSADVCIQCPAASANNRPGQTACIACVSGYYASTTGMSSCSPCWQGSYSRAGMTSCIPCSMGTMSTVHAAASSIACVPCPAGSWSEGNTTACSMCGECEFWAWPRKFHMTINSPLTSVASVAKNYKWRLCLFAGGVAAVQLRSMYILDTSTGSLVDMQVAFPGNGFSSITGVPDSPFIYAVQTPNLFRVDTTMGLWDVVYPASFPQSAFIDVHDGPCLWVAQSDGIKCLDPVLTITHRFFPVTGGPTGVCRSVANTSDPHIYVTTQLQGFISIHATSGAVKTLAPTLRSLQFCRFTPDNRFVFLATPSQLWAFSMLDASSMLLMDNTLVDDILLITNNTAIIALGGKGVHNMTFRTVDSADCSPGKYSLFSGLQHETQCILCPPGRICSGGANFSRCAPGTYSFETGLRSQAQCIPCPHGYYCSGGTVKTICPAGSYSLRSSLRTPEECSACPSGYFCPNTTSQIKCPDNTMSVERSADFSSCRCMPGFMCELIKVVHVQIIIPITMQQFDQTTRNAYVDAIAAAAAVTAAEVAIVSVAEVGIADLAFDGFVNGAAVSWPSVNPGHSRALLQTLTSLVHTQIHTHTHASKNHPRNQAVHHQALHHQALVEDAKAAHAEPLPVPALDIHVSVRPARTGTLEGTLLAPDPEAPHPVLARLTTSAVAEQIHTRGLPRLHHMHAALHDEIHRTTRVSNAPVQVVHGGPVRQPRHGHG
jgi:hypothetical protein